MPPDRPIPENREPLAGNHQVRRAEKSRNTLLHDQFQRTIVDDNHRKTDFARHRFAEKIRPRGRFLGPADHVVRLRPLQQRLRQACAVVQQQVRTVRQHGADVAGMGLDAIRTTSVYAYPGFTERGDDIVLRRSGLPVRTSAAPPARKTPHMTAVFGSICKQMPIVFPAHGCSAATWVRSALSTGM